jgi:hypothetical protein
MPMFDYELHDKGVTVGSGSVWLDQQPPPGRIEFSTGDRWWRCTAVTAPSDPSASGRIVCQAVPPGSEDQ